MGQLIVNYKTYIAAVGLLGLALYQATQGDFQTASATFLTAFVAVGLRHETAFPPPSLK